MSSLDLVAVLQESKQGCRPLQHNLVGSYFDCRKLVVRLGCFIFNQVRGLNSSWFSVLMPVVPCRCYTLGKLYMREKACSSSSVSLVGVD
jgi:hypothetical protein